MGSSITLEHLAASGRRPTPAPFVRTSLLSNYMSLTPTRGYPYLHATQEARNEDVDLDIQTGVTDDDEVYDEKCEAAAAADRALLRSQQRSDSVFDIPMETYSPSSRKNGNEQSIVTLEPVHEGKQLVCASLWAASEYAKLFFDAETPLASDEEFALRSILAAGYISDSVKYLVARRYDTIPPAPKLLVTSHWNKCCGHVSEGSYFHVSPLIEQIQNVTSDHPPSRKGRSPMPSHSTIVPGEVLTEEPWQLEHDPVLRYATSRTTLPGINHLRNVTARSVVIQYGHEIENLFHASKNFFDDYHDGECACLTGELDGLRVPGENFTLAENDGDLGLSVRRSTTWNISDLIDELVNVDMFDARDDCRDVSQEAQPRQKVYFDNTPQNVKASMAYGRHLYPSNFDAEWLVCDKEDVSDGSGSDTENSSLSIYSGLTYVDADTQQCINYTAFNQLLSMEENETRPVIHRDMPDEEDETDIGLAELVYLHPKTKGHEALLPRSTSSDLNKSSFGFNAGIARPPARLQAEPRTYSTVRQRCEPYGLYSSNRSEHQLHLPQLRLATQLLPTPRPLSMVKEEELSCSRSSSFGESLDFAGHRGFVKPVMDRKRGFLDDGDESEDDVESSLTLISTSNYLWEDVFIDDVWDSTPDLALSQPSQESYATVALAPGLSPPPPLLKAFEIEIHSRLTFMFECMNSGRCEELPAISNDLHWALCALAHSHPALTLLDSLGAALEILVERIVACNTTASSLSICSCRPRLDK